MAAGLPSRAEKSDRLVINQSQRLMLKFSTLAAAWRKKNQ